MQYQLTILVPSINRSEFLIRMMHYYAQKNFKGVLLIGDSSREQEFKRTADVVTLLKQKLDVRHIDCGGMDDREAIFHLTDLLTTEYVAFLGDDDFLIPSGLDECIKYLDRHSDYISANGDAFAVQLDAKGAYGRISRVDAYPQPNCEEPTARERVLSHLASYSVTIFGVHRVTAWRKMWGHTLSIQDRAFSAELAPSCIAPALGKIKHLKKLYLVRQSHLETYHLPGPLLWLTGSAWQGSFRKFLKAVSNCIDEIDHSTGHPTSSELESVFTNFYLARLFPRQFSYKEILHMVLTQLPFGKRIWFALAWLNRAKHSMAQGIRHGVVLNIEFYREPSQFELMRTGSYYSEFRALNRFYSNLR